jgi:hypothetical protein
VDVVDGSAGSEDDVRDVVLDPQRPRFFIFGATVTRAPRVTVEVTVWTMVGE